jgi:hypothetical protein
MSSVVIDVVVAVADEIRTAVTANTLLAALDEVVVSTAWAARRRELAATDGSNQRPLVHVALLDWRRRLAARGRWQTDIALEVGLRQLVPDDERDAETGEVADATVDRLASALDELWDFFAPLRPGSNGRRLSSLPEAAWRPNADDDGWTPLTIDWEALASRKQFVGLFELYYTVTRDQ